MRRSHFPYAVEENDRLLDACTALSKHDLDKFGSLMYQTHEGLSSDYQVSCPELDYLVELTKDNPNIHGSRMMGGGFGGCTINIIDNNAVEEIEKFIMHEYKKKFNKDATVYVTSISDGSNTITI